MPSIYHGCSIQDEAFDAVQAFDQHLRQVEEEFDSALENLNNIIQSLEQDANAASVVIGTGDWAVKWIAKQPGIDGNKINISYVYQGPDLDPNTNTLIDREPSGEIQPDGVSVILWLGVNADGTIKYDMSTTLTKWFSNVQGLADLLTYDLVGSGAAQPEPTENKFLTGGTSQLLKDIEAAGNEIASSVGQPTLKDLFTSVGIPTAATEENIKKYLEQGANFVIINGKLFLISGTNLIAYNKLYEITKDINIVKQIISKVEKETPTVVITQNISRTVTEFVCGKPQTVTEVTEVYRGLDLSISNSIAKWGGGPESFHYYVFWGEKYKASIANYRKLRLLGLPDNYIENALEGQGIGNNITNEFLASFETFVIEDIELLNKLGLTDSELEELLSKKIDGVDLPTNLKILDKINLFKSLLKDRPETNENGTDSKIKPALVAPQVTNINKILPVKDLSKELATRGKACARLSSKVPDLTKTFGKVTNIDFSSASFDQLPDPSKKVESAYAALSSAIEKADNMFNRMLDKLFKTVSGFINKITDFITAASNFGGNKLAKCLLGTGTGVTGKPEFSDLGIQTPSGLPEISSITGGIPLDLFKSVLEEMNKVLDETVTEAVSIVMSLLQIPLCIVNSLMSSITGFDLGGSLNICKDKKDADDKCHPAGIQAVINDVQELANNISDIEHLANETTEVFSTEIEETVEEFTGIVKQTVTKSTNAITRGLNEVMSDLQKSINEKVAMVTKMEKAINELFNDADEQKTNIEETTSESSSCLPPVLGLMTDSITDYL